jgi:methyl-accepting chemotaxis protein
MDDRGVLARFRGLRASLAVQFSIFAGIALIAISALSAYLGAQAQRRALMAEVERQTEHLARLLAAQSANAVFAYNLADLNAAVQAFTTDPAVRRVEIRDKSGKVLRTAGDSGDRRGVVVATHEIKAGGDVVGSALVALTTDSVEASVTSAWRFSIARELAGLVLLFLILTFLVRREVSRPLAVTVDLLKGMESDLTRRMEVKRRNEVGELGRWFNSFADRMHQIIAEVRGSADGVASASHQIASAAGHISTSAQEQASSLEETATSLEELTATVKQNAHNALQASQLALSSREAAEKGGKVVADAIESMKEITRASKRIAEIIAVIDEIAFQTNLLALNAAVEAARAGEQGRGFAVVATEVRSLAQRSAAAARQIKGLIEDSVQKVESGSELVTQSGQTLEEIVSSVKRATDIVAEIAAASQEQSQGIEQVNRAVSQMDQVVQANATQTERLSSTARSLAAQAVELQALVSRFRLRDGAMAGSPEGSGVVTRDHLRAPAGAHDLPGERVPALTGGRGAIWGRAGDDNGFGSQGEGWAPGRMER